MINSVELFSVEANKDSQCDMKYFKKIAVNLVCHMNNVVFSEFLDGFSRNLVFYVFRKINVFSFVRIYHKKNIFVGITPSQIFKMGTL